MSFICGNCKGRHPSVADARICHLHGPAALAPKPVVSRASERQLAYIKSLGGIDAYDLAKNMTVAAASEFIDRLKKERPMDPYSAPNRNTTKIPLAMLKAIPPGYYAIQKDDGTYSFYRVSQPKTGRYKDCKKFQSQHGENYNMVLALWPSDSLTWYNMTREDDLLIIAVNYNACAIEYGQKIGRCCRCNKDLTDERSRWFGIGPECEKYWPHIIDLVTDTKGAYEYA